MILSRRLTGLYLVILALSACNHAAPPPAAHVPAVVADPREHLNRIVERYWDNYMALNPSTATAVGDHRFNAHLENAASLQYLADSLALERGALAEIASLPADKLDAAQRLTYEIFKAERESAIRDYVFPEELLPVNHIAGMPQRFAQMGAGDGIHPFASARDYEDWLGRIDDFLRWNHSAIANMREGIRRGYVLPRPIVQRMLPQLAVLSQDRADNPFYGPLRTFPDSVNSADRARLTARLNAAAKTRILPAYRELHDFLRNEYLPVARTSIGLSALPMGESWYAARARRATSMAMTPAQLHALGLSEAERLRVRLLGAMSQAGFGGNLNAFFVFLAHDPRFYFHGAEELLNAYREFKPRAAAASASLFASAPAADFEIRSAAEFLLAAAPAAAYRAASRDGESPAILYVNTVVPATRPNFAVPFLFLQEAVPGRHFQYSIQLERRDLPLFRRFGDVPAFQEGWSVYAAGLGDELGLYTDPYMRVGALIDELRRALRVVVDTGIHATGWTRQHAIDYLASQFPAGDGDAVAEVERCIAMPGAGLAATVGALKFREIRGKAQAVLGSRFDVRAFHSELIKDGAMPLDLLESKMNRWIRAVQTAPVIQAPPPAAASAAVAPPAVPETP